MNNGAGQERKRQVGRHQGRRAGRRRLDHDGLARAERQGAPVGRHARAGASGCSTARLPAQRHGASSGRRAHGADRTRVEREDHTDVRDRGPHVPRSRDGRRGGNLHRERIFARARRHRPARPDTRRAAGRRPGDRSRRGRTDLGAPRCARRSGRDDRPDPRPATSRRTGSTTTTAHRRAWSSNT